MDINRLLASVCAAYPFKRLSLCFVSFASCVCRERATTSLSACHQLGEKKHFFAKTTLDDVQANVCAKSIKHLLSSLACTQVHSRVSPTGGGCCSPPTVVLSISHHSHSLINIITLSSLNVSTHKGRRLLTRVPFIHRARRESVGRILCWWCAVCVCAWLVQKLSCFVCLFVSLRFVGGHSMGVKREGT